MHKLRNILSLMLAFTLLFGTATLASAQDPTPTPAAEEEMAAMNIVETAIAAGSFTTLVAAVQAAGLVETLSGEGPFTVFAPTDDAFAALPDGTIDALLADPSGALTDILLYHVVEGKALSTDLSDGMTIDTAGGGTLTVSINANGVQINDVNVVSADIMASNGVIHVIDAVLIPPAEAAAAEATATPAAEEEMAAAAATATPAAEEEAMAEATPTPAAEEEMAAAAATATPAAEEEAMAEATPTPAAEEEMAAAAATGTPAAEEEMAAAAPEMLPVTGGSQAEQNNSALPWAVVVFAVVVAGSVLFFRRRVA